MPVGTEGSIQQALDVARIDLIDRNQHGQGIEHRTLRPMESPASPGDGAPYRNRMTTQLKGASFHRSYPE